MGLSRWFSSKESAFSAGATGDTGQSLGQEDPWKRTWQPTPVFLPGEPPWTEEPGRLQSMGLQKSQTQLSD